MRECITKKGTSAQTFQLLLSDALSVELLVLLLLLLLLLLLGCWRVPRILAGI